VLKEASDTTLAGQTGTYQDPAIPIMPDVVRGIADWILKTP